MIALSQVISCGGSPPIEVCSRLSPSFAPWLTLKEAVFHGRVCGLGLLRGWPFLLGWWP